MVSILWWNPYLQIKILSDSWHFINKNWFNSYLSLFHYRAHKWGIKIWPFIHDLIVLLGPWNPPAISGSHLLHHPALTKDQLDCTVPGDHPYRPPMADSLSSPGNLSVIEHFPNQSISCLLLLKGSTGWGSFTHISCQASIFPMGYVGTSSAEISGILWIRQLQATVWVKNYLWRR